MSLTLGSKRGLYNYFLRHIAWMSLFIFVWLNLYLDRSYVFWVEYVYLETLEQKEAEFEEFFANKV